MTASALGTSALCVRCLTVAKGLLAALGGGAVGVGLTGRGTQTIFVNTDAGQLVTEGAFTTTGPEALGIMATCRGTRAFGSGTAGPIRSRSSVAGVAFGTDRLGALAVALAACGALGATTPIEA